MGWAVRAAPLPVLRVNRLYIYDVINITKGRKKIKKITINQDLPIDIYDKSAIIVIVKGNNATNIKIIGGKQNDDL